MSKLLENYGLIGNCISADESIGLAGERWLSEHDVPWLPGSEQSRPVRSGNDTIGQMHLQHWSCLQSEVAEVFENTDGRHAAEVRSERLRATGRTGGLVHRPNARSRRVATGEEAADGATHLTRLAAIAGAQGAFGGYRGPDRVLAPPRQL